MYRYNFGVHFVLDDNLITLIYPQKKIIIKGKVGLGEFLKYALLNVYVQGSDLEEYKITPINLQLLLTYKVLVKVSIYKSGFEALLFHQLAENPNKVDTDIDQDAINILYKNASAGIEDFVNTDLFMPVLGEISSRLNGQIIGNIQGSIRQNKKSSFFDEEFFKKSLYTCLLKNNAGHHSYGSGGGFYSVFALSITENDGVYIFDPKKGVIYTSKMLGIYENCKNTLLFDNEYSLTGYGAIVILLSDTKNVLKKYGNRGYRFIMIESGAIGLLLRQVYSERGYLEMGGYYDEEVYSLIRKYKILDNLEDILVTHLILLSH